MNIIQAKYRRLLEGDKPRVLDLFAGCGGISLGFHSEGFDIKGAIEYDEHAAKTHALNFHQESENFEIYSEAIDITKISAEDYVKKYFPKENLEDCFDIIVGGPPCQAFARVGRAKLREVAEHPEAFRQDPRGNLYLRYLDYVSKLKPVAILMENVPDVLNFGGHNIAEEVAEVLSENGYIVKYTLLNSAFYGAPQMRERMILVAYSKSVIEKISFPPKPSHWIDLPRGYHGSRQVALKTINQDLIEEQKYFVEPVKPIKKECKKAITAKEAINDLPTLTEHLKGNIKRGARRFNELMKYSAKKESAYAKQMKSWEGFENTEGIKDHVIRYLPRDYQIFALMNPGDQYPEAHKHALNIFERELEKKGNNAPAEGSAEFEELKKSIVPPYSPDKFPNKWRKMEADMPARTLLAHLGKDGYSHIHYDSKQARTISVREAARLQSFPDGFIFSGTMNPAFKQIGNSVPPLFAKALAKNMMENLLKPTENVEKISVKEVNRV